MVDGTGPHFLLKVLAKDRQPKIKKIRPCDANNKDAFVIALAKKTFFFLPSGLQAKKT